MGFRQSLWSIRTSDGAGVSHLDYPTLRRTRPTACTTAWPSGPTARSTPPRAQRHIAVLKLDVPTASSTQTGTIIATQEGDFPWAWPPTPRATCTSPTTTRAVRASPAVSRSTTRRPPRRSAGSIHRRFGGTPNFPLAVAALADGSKVYVASQRDASVYVFDTADPATPTLAATMTDRSHPIALLLDKAQTRLFVANAHSDTVSIIDTASERRHRQRPAAPGNCAGRSGATPTGLALSPDEKPLYVTLGDMNAVAVVDSPPSRRRRATSPPAGIPPAWSRRPTAAPAGRKRQGHPDTHPNPATASRYNDTRHYDLNLIEGHVCRRPFPPSRHSRRKPRACRGRQRRRNVCATKPADRHRTARPARSRM